MPSSRPTVTPRRSSWSSAATRSDYQSHAARQIAERFVDAASMRYRMFLGASSCVPFPSFADETDKAASMQAEAVAARQLLTVIGRVAPGALHSGSGARAGGGKVADDDDDDDDDGDGDDVGGGGGGGGSTAAKNKRRREKQEPGDSGYSRRGRATSHATPGDFKDRVQSDGDVVTFTWLSRDAKPECIRSFDAGGVKAAFADFGVENADKICVPLQFMYAISMNFGDGDFRLAHAYRFCPRAGGRAQPRPHQVVGALVGARSAPAAARSPRSPESPAGERCNH